MSTRFRVVIRILRYNWWFYAVTTLGAALALALRLGLPLPAPLRLAIDAGVGTAVVWSLVSLAVSHYVYDRSALGDWRWVVAESAAPIRRWASVHAGLDHAGEALWRLLPFARGRVLDIYDAREMPAPSIARARRCAPPAVPATRAHFDALPLEDGGCDALFLIFTAHELRRRPARLRLFGELRRALAPGGMLVLVEHLRDAWNVLAFGPGALHFLPHREWVGLAEATGLRIARERSITPFVRAFVLRRVA